MAEPTASNCRVGNGGSNAEARAVPGRIPATRKWKIARPTLLRLCLGFRAAAVQALVANPRAWTFDPGHFPFKVDCIQTPPSRTHKLSRSTAPHPSRTHQWTHGGPEWNAGTVPATRFQTATPLLGPWGGARGMTHLPTHPNAADDVLLLVTISS